MQKKFKVSSSVSKIWKKCWKTKTAMGLDGTGHWYNPWSKEEIWNPQESGTVLKVIDDGQEGLEAAVEITTFPDLIYPRLQVGVPNPVYGDCG
jgi:hypothetical protein